MENVCELCGKSLLTGECVCDLNLDPVVEEHPVESDLTPEEEKLVEKIKQKQIQEDIIMNGFKALGGKPSDEMIEEWKKVHGKIFTIGFDSDEYYVFRPLKRLEWRNLTAQLAKQPDESKRQEAICIRSVLWPKLDPMVINNGLAGSVSSLYEVILQASNFLAPQEALACVRKL